MTTRKVGLFAIALAAVASTGCLGAETPRTTESAARKQAEPKAPTRPECVVGYYALDDPARYMAKQMKDVPSGQVMHLGIEKGRWMMRDMLIGYGGTWVVDKGGAILTVNEGPTGKTSGKEVFKATRTATGIMLSDEGSSGLGLSFTYLGPSAPKEFGYAEFLGPSR